jgi:hypothetical protein
MDEKTIQRIKKLQALAERGVGGEKTTAQKKLAKLLKDNGINSLDELQKEEYEYTIFSYKGKHEIKLLRQCMYKVMGAKSDRTAYKPYGRRQKIGIYCTKAQKIEIELEFEFYRNVFYEELSTFMDAFIQAQKIFPEDAPVGDYDEFNERDMKIAFMATGIERRSRAAMIEESEAEMRKRKRQAVKKLIQCAAVIAVGVLAIILFMLAIWYRGKNSEPVTDEQVAAQMQQAEPLVIETPEAATEGSIRVYDYDGCCIYSYYGKIRINSDGKDGKEIDVEALGYLEGYQEHKEESRAGE